MDNHQKEAKGFSFPISIATSSTLSQHPQLSTMLSIQQWHLSMLMFIISIPLVLGISSCSQCRPLDLQRAPGIGIDLTMAYGAASIRFRNSTPRPLGIINGTAEYQAAMQLLAEEWAKPYSMFGPIQTQRRQDTDGIFQRWRWGLSLWTWPLFEAASPPAQPTYLNPAAAHDEYASIVSMLSALKSLIFETAQPPLKYHSVYLSIPDIPYAGWRYNHYFKFLCSLAGLEMLGSSSASLHALQYNGVKNWYGPGDEPPPHIDFFYPHNMLTISYNAASLGVSLSTRDGGWVSTADRVNQSTRHGADNIHAIVGYWDEVRALLLDVIGDAAIDYVLIIGSHAREGDLLQVLQNVITGHGNIDPSVLDRYVQGPAFKENKEADLFASAGQAAVLARFGMQTGYEACLVPDHCPVDDEDIFKHEDWWSILGIPDTEGIQ
ncbi:hypothetical protein BJX63DRAFT_414697 [Aspergillus granulosus]|uniref:Uncharacterized protein n=1 Tax=Aspergillus granulosus TaxID=176169 RepID=A0ABR4GU62_9EURO